MGLNLALVTEAHIYARHIRSTKPNAMIGVLFQNDVLGKPFLKGIREGLGSGHGVIVRAATTVALLHQVPARMRLTSLANLPGHSGVDLPDLLVRPADRVLGRHALHSLGIHVDDDVFAQHLGRLAVCRSGIAREAAAARRHPVG